MSTEPAPGKNTYLIDTESGAEMARLLNQDRLLTKGMGGLLAERDNDFSGFRRVLDVACGPGGWAQEVARAHPSIEVVGIDISQTMIDYARAQTQAQGLTNASFIVMDALKPLDFPDNSFDLVNLRYLTGFVPTSSWLPLIQEMYRVARVRGIIRLTDSECGISNKPALAKLTGMLVCALHLSGHCFSPDERVIGNIVMLGHFLRKVGCRNVQYMAHAIEFSAGTEAHSGIYEDWKVICKLIQSSFIDAGITTRQEMEQLYEQLLTEMMLDDFCAVYDLVTAWGEKV
jgi:ubiquinone/menaquinone biosynthesis C-methylase UbiE